MRDATPPNDEQLELTIDQLAQRTGMTVRNIRAHQSRGLLPAPEVRGRTGFYGAEHVARIELIKELQADGFNLEAIRRLIESARGSTGNVLRFTRAVASGFEDEAPHVVELGELADRWGERGDPSMLQRAIDLGLLRPLGDGRYEERSPRLAQAGRELADLGIGAEKMFDVTAVVRRHTDGIARAFVQLFLDEVWEPFDRAGRPEGRWPEVFDAYERLRPLAAEAVIAMFGLVMTERVDEALGVQMERLAGARREAS